MEDLEEKIAEIKTAIEEWIKKQGHDSCWYYPEIFREIAGILDIKYEQPNLPPRKEFEVGCSRYQEEVYQLKK